MKKFLVFTAIMMAFVAAAFYHNGLLGRFNGGTFTVYRENTSITMAAPLLDKYGGVQRLDLKGRYNIDEVLNAYDASMLWSESFDDMTVVYAYSPMLLNSATVKGKTVNLMFALKNESVAIGTPILKGSY